MKQVLISERNRYKGNLHCHTTLSDGRLTPEEICQAYRARGYAFLALSDHDKYYEHDDLQRKDFVVLNAYEQCIDRAQREPFGQGKCYHFNFFAKTPAHHELNIPPVPDYEDKAGINRMIADIKAQDFLCSYNHPYWSLQNFEDYTPLAGVDFLEVFNYGCYIGDGLHENQINVYDDMLRWGHCKPLFCTMTDDNHNVYPPDDYRTDSFGGWVMAGADELSYEAIIKALETGDFYCSCGPEICYLAVDTEAKTVEIRTKPVKSISLSTIGRRGDRVEAEPGKTIDHALFPLRDNDGYFRIEVTDANGRRANTNAYFLDDLFNK